MKNVTLKLISCGALALATACQQDNLADGSHAAADNRSSSMGMTAEVQARATCFFDEAFPGLGTTSFKPDAAFSTELTAGTIVAIPNVTDTRISRTKIGSSIFTDGTYLRVSAGTDDSRTCYVEVKKLSARITASADGTALIPFGMTPKDMNKNPQQACYLNSGDVVTFHQVLAIEDSSSKTPQKYTLNGRSIIIRITKITSGQADATTRSDSCTSMQNEGDGKIDLKSFREGEIILKSPFHRG